MPTMADLMNDAVQRGARAFCGCSLCTMESTMKGLKVLRCPRALHVADALDAVRSSLPALPTRRSELRQEADALWAAGDKRGATELHEMAAKLEQQEDSEG